MTDKAVSLAYRTDNANTDGKEVLACARCKNKAWTVVYDDLGEQYPRLARTACATDGGMFGWVSSLVCVADDGTQQTKEQRCKNECSVEKVVAARNAPA